MPIADLLPNSLGPYLTLMILGFAVAIAGHLVGSRLVVGLGILMIFLATALLPLTINATDETPERPGPEAFPPGYR